MQQLARFDIEPKRSEAELGLGRHAGVSRRSFPTSYAAVAYCLSVCTPVAGRRSILRPTVRSTLYFATRTSRARAGCLSLAGAECGTRVGLRRSHTQQVLYVSIILANALFCGGQGRNRTTDTRIFSPRSKTL